MAHDDPHSDALDEQRLLSGKRRTPRQQVSLEVKCIGGNGRGYAARTVDVSRGGMLIEIVDPDFLPPVAGAEILSYAARVAEEFPDGLHVSFGDGSVQVRASVVRLATRPIGAPLVLLGCAFDPTLSYFVCDLLGIKGGLDETKAAPLPAPRDPMPEPAPAPAPKRHAPHAGKNGSVVPKR